jgi:hypothetical protein
MHQLFRVIPKHGEKCAKLQGEQKRTQYRNDAVGLTPNRRLIKV